MKNLIVLAFAIALFASTTPTYAQEKKSSWGVQVGVTPQWRHSSLLEDIASGDLDLRGSEFAFGIIRGRTLGGDWGVSFVRKSINDASFIDNHFEECHDLNGLQCFQAGTLYRFRGASLTGLEVHKFVPFVTIRKRVQLGMNFAGGVVWPKGSVEKRNIDLRLNEDDPLRPVFEPVETVSIENAADAMEDVIGLSTLPMARIEAVVAFIVAPGLKVKVSSGIGIPGDNRFSVGLAYFF